MASGDRFASTGLRPGLAIVQAAAMVLSPTLARRLLVSHEKTDERA